MLINFLKVAPTYLIVIPILFLGAGLYNIFNAEKVQQRIIRQTLYFRFLQKTKITNWFYHRTLNSVSSTEYLITIRWSSLGVIAVSALSILFFILRLFFPDGEIHLN